jgi:hypothetical protein
MVFLLSGLGDMPMTRVVPWSVMLAGLIGVAGCGGGSRMGNSPMVTGASSTSTASSTMLAAVVPSGNSVAVPTGTTVVMRFNHAMASGMESYLDLHEGDTSGPTTPMSCGWSSDRTVLTCQPDSPLKAQTRYVIHMGDGMMDADDHLVNMDQGLAMGGQWLMAGMMGGLHAGSPMGMMGSGWRGSNGSYGMVFPFTTS